MTVHDAVQLLCTIVTLGIFFLARDRLRMNTPKVRIALGGISIILATVVFSGLMELLPRPWETGFSPVVDAAALATCSFFGGVLVLSLIEIGGGIIQTIKRQQHHRRNLS